MATAHSTAAADTAARHAAVAAACEAIAAASPWYNPATYADTKALCTACTDKNIDLVKSILKKGVNPDGRVVIPVSIPGDPAEPQETETVSALLISSQMNLPACVAVLLDHGADVTIASSKGVTALHAACREALPEMAALLLDRGAAVDARAHDGTPAILDAAAAGSTECVRLLLDRGAAADSAANPDRFDRTPLLASLWAENIDCVRLLLTRGADPNGILGGGGDVPDMRAIPLHVAAMQGSADAVAALLDAGADIRRADAHGHQALHVAAAVSDPPPDASVVKCLLARGADPNVLVPGKGFGTPLMFAARAGCRAAVAALIAAGADPRAVNAERGECPLACACDKGGGVEIVKMLLDAGADPRATWSEELASVDGPTVLDGITPLFAAANAGHADIVAELLAIKNDAGERAVEVDAANSMGVTPLAAAVMGEHRECVVALLEAGADPNIERVDAHTPLTFAAANGLVDLAGLLIASGRADVNRVSAKGFTPMIVAQHFKHTEIVEALVEAGATAGRGTSVSSCTVS